MDKCKQKPSLNVFNIMTMVELFRTVLSDFSVDDGLIPFLFKVRQCQPSVLEVECFKSDYEASFLSVSFFLKDACVEKIQLFKNEMNNVSKKDVFLNMSESCVEKSIVCKYIEDNDLRNAINYLVDMTREGVLSKTIESALKELSESDRPTFCHVKRNVFYYS